MVLYLEVLSLHYLSHQPCVEGVTGAALLSSLVITNVEKREELADKWRAEGVPSYEIKRRFQKEGLFLHRN